MRRKAFLKDAAGAAAMLACFPAGLSGVEWEKARGKMELRTLGKTGRSLSIIGFGGLVLKNSTPAQAAEWVREAFEAGVNYFDVAPSYGNSEGRLAPVPLSACATGISGFGSPPQGVRGPIHAPG